MSSGKKVLIGLGIFLLLLAGLAYYGNSQVDRMIDKLAQSGMVQLNGAAINAGSGSGAEAGIGERGGASSNNLGGINSGLGTQNSEGAGIISPDGTSGGAAPGSVAGSPALTPEQNKVLSSAERYVGRQVERRDVLIAGNIIISRFSWGEINYLYQAGSNGLNSKQEARQVRDLLLSRLSGGDIATLTSIGNKYGLSLKILDASYEIR